MFFSLSNTEQASPIKLLWQLFWLLPHFSPPTLPQKTNKQVKETELMACHWILKYRKKTFLQPSWQASKRFRGRKGESEGGVPLSLLFCLSPSPPPSHQIEGLSQTFQTPFCELPLNYLCIIKRSKPFRNQETGDVPATFPRLLHIAQLPTIWKLGAS